MTESPAALARAGLANEQQAGLWFIHQNDPACGAYHIVFSAEVTATPGFALRAKDVVDDLVRTHSALRAAYRVGDSGPEIGVTERVTPDISALDARGIDREALRAQIRADAREPFDLASPPLWRVRLYRTGPDVWVLAVALHHAAFDFWTLALLLGEVRDRLAGETPRLSLDGDVFVEYADRQRSFLDSAEAQEILQAEAGRLADAPLSLELYGDRRRPANPSYDGGSIPFSLTARTTAQLRQLARDAESTPYEVLLTAYFVLLSRLSGQTDLTVGTPTSGRLTRSLQGALGNFVNTVVVRSQIDEARSYRELIAQVRGQAREAIKAQQLPFPWLVRQLAPPRDPSRTPLYQAGFAWDRLPFLEDLGEFFLLGQELGASIEIGGATVRPFPVAQQEGQTDLWVEMGAEHDGALGGVLRYSVDVFDAGAALEVARGFTATLAALVDAPDVPLKHLDLAAGNDDRRLQEWGTGPKRTWPAQRLPELFRDQAHRTPDRVALAFGDERWTYARLLASVEEAVRALRASGIVAGDRVAVLVERGPRLLVALLAVLEADAAYVPLDLQLPAERMAYMVQDSRATVVLSEEAVRAHWLPGLSVVSFDDLESGLQMATSPIAAPSPDDSPPMSSWEDLAYVLYTSGSTGRPKGVAIPHSALVNLLLSMVEETGFGAEDRMLAVTTAAFDIAGLELFMPLLVGGTVIICDEATSSDGLALAKLVDSCDATWMQATPTTWRMLRDAGWGGKATLNVLCGGENLPTDLARYLSERLLSLRNVYGPTETTIWSTCGLVDADGGVDLGRPLANTQLYVLDAHGRPVQPGFPGELWIGGAGLALGYWDRPELTLDRFVRGLPAAPRSRLYRTGDRVRWTTDGRLLYYDRLDNQIKLRGYRIETAEVEAVMQEIDGVSAAAVVVRDDVLIAYVVPDPGAELAPSALKAVSSAMLPPYAVPGIVAVLDEFPLTANKKLDRAALPAPAIVATADFEEPRDATEITLARLWCSVLGLSKVGINDDFFDIGGHSLLAVRLAAAVRDEWGIDLPISELIRHSTIAQLASVVRDGAGREATPVVVLRDGAPGSRPLFLFHPFGGTVFCYLEVTRHLPEHVPVIAIEAPGIASEDEAEVSVEDMARRYVEAIRGVQQGGPYLLGGWCFGGVLAFAAAGVLKDIGETVDLVVGIDSRAPIEQNIPDSADDATLLSWFARDLAVPYGKTLDLPADTLRALGDGAFERILAEASALGVLPADTDRGTLLRYFETYLANGIALQTYLPAPQDIDLLLLRAIAEPTDYGPDLGWTSVTKTLDVVEVPGDHNSVMYPPNAAVVADLIATRLEGLDHGAS